MLKYVPLEGDLRTPIILEKKQKKENSTAKQKSVERTMLFETKGNNRKDPKASQPSSSASGINKTKPKTTPSTNNNNNNKNGPNKPANKTTRELGNVVRGDGSAGREIPEDQRANRNNATNGRERAMEDVREDQFSGNADEDSHYSPNPDISLPVDLQNEVMNHLQSMLIKNEQSQHIRDETDLAVKTLQKWHHQHPDAQPTHLAAVVGRLAERLLSLQSPSPSPSLPPRSAPSPKSKKKPPLKPPARKKRPAQPKRPLPLPHTNNNYPVYDTDFHNGMNFSDSNFNQEPPLYASTFITTDPLPPKPRVIKKRNDLAEWQEVQRHSGAQVGTDWTLLRTQQPLASKLAARLGRNALAQVDILARAILDDLCTETAMLMTEMENERESGYTTGKGSSRDILEQHQLANDMKQIFSELSEYEKQEKQLVADAHHELITQAHERSSTENTSTRDPIRFTSSPPVHVSHPPVDSIISGMKEFEKHVKKKNGGADPIAIGNIVAESILSELVNSTANDLFGVCDSMVKSEFVV